MTMLFKQYVFGFWTAPWHTISITKMTRKNRNMEKKTISVIQILVATGVFQVLTHSKQHVILEQNQLGNWSISQSSIDQSTISHN